MIIRKYIYISLITLISTFMISCEDERLDPALDIADGGSTLTSYKAYTIEGVDEEDVYGRVVFWESSTFGTLAQLSLYGVMEGDSYNTMLTGASAMSMYTVENTGEGLSFGEFSTSKFFHIDVDGFYEGLETYDGMVQIMTGDGTMVASGPIGINADPVETN